MAEYYIGRNGAEVVFPAGYLNRATKRRLAKKDPALLEKLLKLQNENKEYTKNVDDEQH